MQRGLYAAATGMLSAQQLLDKVSHNLANVSTNGYKRDGAVFNDTLRRALFNDQGAYIGDIGAGTWKTEEYTDLEVGTTSITGNPLDVALQTKEGFFAVQTDSGVRYTRDGSFAINSQGQLVTRQGLQVLDASENPIQLPKGKIEIDNAGKMSADGKAVATIGIFDGKAKKIGNGLFEGKNMTPKTDPLVQPGALEGSNVNAIEEMIAMIQLNRIFELSQRGAQSQDEMTQKLLQSIQNR